MKALGFTALSAVALTFAMPVMAQEKDPYPFDNGDYVEVTGIELSDGSDLKYAQWLAGEWRTNEDYAVSQGWLSRYEVLTNTHPRDGEPDIYLVRYFPSFIDNAEGERRRQVMAGRYKRNEAKLQEESAGRANYRKVLSSTLLRKMEWKR